MKCLKCDFETDSLICKKCGADNAVFSRVYKISDALYNKGLEQARNNNLFDATLSLGKSLQFNKNNYEARNLLGLIYYATGRLGDALREWILSSNITNNNSNNSNNSNKAVGYISSLKKNPVVFEKQNEAVKMYNNALTFMLQKSEDMAVIQLKKALDLSPDFIDALNLLALCYIMLGDNKKATIYIERVLSIDANNLIALNYHKIVNPTPAKARVGAGHIKESSPVEEKKPVINYKNNNFEKNKFGIGFGINYIIMFVIGGICSFLIVYMFFMTPAISAMQAEITKITDDLQKETQKHIDEMALKDRTIENNNKKMETLENDKKSLNSTIESQRRSQYVLEADITLRDGNPLGALDLINGFDATGLSKDIAEKYESVKLGASLQLEKEAYDYGKEAYDARDYEEAKLSFRKSVQYTTPESTTIGNCYYYMGRIAEVEKDTNSAIIFYEKLLNDFKDSTTTSLYNTANTRLKNLTS